MDEETCMEMMRSYYEVRSTNSHEENNSFHSVPGLLREAARAGVQLLPDRLRVGLPHQHLQAPGNKTTK